jgi:hypothetical protein
MILKDRILETTSTSGTGVITLDGASDGFQSFSVLGDQTYYTITNGSSWEVGAGTYSSGTLSRDSVFDSSESGNLISLSGSSSVFCTYPASKAVFKNLNDQIVIPQSGLIFYDSTVKTSSNKSIINATGDISLSTLDEVVFVETSGQVEIDLPSAISNDGKEFVIKYVSGEGPIVINPSGSETIDGDSSLNIYYQKESISIISNGANWFIV